MHRFAVALAVFVSITGYAQVQNVSDPQAIALAQQSTAALTKGIPVGDVLLKGNVIWIAGSDNETGTAILRAKGSSESRVDLMFPSGTRSEVRYMVNGYPSGSWQKNAKPSNAVPQHNCWNDAAWFFPALSSLAQTSNPNFLFKYIGTEQHGGVSTLHLQVSQAGLGIPTAQKFSTLDFYLDPTSSLPLAVAFQVHADADASLNIPAEVRFASYQSVNGVQVPFHIQRMLNGGVVLDITLTGATFNSRLSDTLFSLQ